MKTMPAIHFRSFVLVLSNSGLPLPQRKRIAKQVGAHSNVGMKIYSLLLGLTALGIGPVLAQDTNNAAPAKIGAMEAAQHYGQNLTVTGMVAQVTLRPGIVFINLDQPYPNSPFAAVIFPSATNRFADLKSLKGRPVEITGMIKNYRDKPEVVIQNPRQLQVDGKPYANSTPAAEPASPGLTPQTPAKTPGATNDPNEIM